MKQPPLFPFLLLAAVLAGCGRPTDSLLVGGWAPPGQACDSQGGVVYDKTGAWAGYDVVGAWTLSGDRLTTRVTERGGYDRPAQKVSGEKAAVATVLSLTQTELVLKLADGSTQKLQRCRK